MKNFFDAVVIGAGASGLSCASLLSKGGFDVLVVEKNPAVGRHTKTKIDITESAGLEKTARKLGISFFGKAKSSRWQSKNKGFVFNYGKVYDFFAKRGPEKDSLDQQLFHSSGADFLFGSAATCFERNKKGEITSVSIKRGSAAKKICCSFVVGADGSWGNSLRLAGLEKTARGNVLISGFGVTAKGIGFPEAQTQVFFDAKLLPGGYFFSANAKDGFGVASVVVNGKRVSASRRLFEKFVNSNATAKSALGNAKTLDYFQGSCKSFSLESRRSNNFLACGDAAGALDPVFGYGVRQALLSANVVAETIKSAASDQTALDSFDSRLEEALGNRILAFKARRLFDSLSDADLDCLAELASFAQSKGFLEDVFDGKVSARAFFSLLSRKPLHLPAILLKFLFA